MAKEGIATVKRSVRSGLAVADPRPRPIVDALLEFLLHGARYAFPAELGGPSRGMPTSFAAPPLPAQLIVSDALPPVWPFADGDARGSSVVPLYPSVPLAARRDAKLYTMLALLDALRLGGAREREVAARELEEEIRAGA